jgi:TonB family protein
LLRWRRYEEPMFPRQLLTTLVQEGFATVVFTFDADGKITDRIVLAASHPAFVTAVYEAVSEWELDTRELRPSMRREMIRFDFARQPAIVPMNQLSAMRSQFSPYVDQPGTAVLTCQEAELRPKLQPQATVAPEFPRELLARHVRGVATVGFVVDAEGRVRVPAVTDASEPEFGDAALAAVRQWRFAPPLQGGVPVRVVAERTFRFGAVNEGPKPVGEPRKPDPAP